MHPGEHFHPSLLVILLSTGCADSCPDGERRLPSSTEAVSCQSAGFARARPVDDGRIVRDSYSGTPPLIRSSRLTSVDRGGVGKDLSEGWSLNYAVGCTHGCPFCYMGSIHRRFGPSRFGEAVKGRWGSYLLTPCNIDELLERTPWSRWKGKEVMLSSSHDPYLPEIAGTTRKILEKALDAGVRFCVQTRSVLVSRDIDILKEHSDQVRVQMSIATMDDRLAAAIEPRVPSPKARIGALAELKSSGIRVGVIVAPVFPPVPMRLDVGEDLRDIAEALSSVEPERIFGESLHRRGSNIALSSAGIGSALRWSPDFDARAGEMFMAALAEHGLRGEWWGSDMGSHK